MMYGSVAKHGMMFLIRMKTRVMNSMGMKTRDDVGTWMETLVDTRERGIT